MSREVSALEALRAVAKLFKGRAVDEGGRGGSFGGRSLNEGSCLREPVATREGEVGGFGGEVEGEVVGSSAAAKEPQSRSQGRFMGIA